MNVCFFLVSTLLGIQVYGCGNSGNCTKRGEIASVSVGKWVSVECTETMATELATSVKVVRGDTATIDNNIYICEIEFFGSKLMNILSSESSCRSKFFEDTVIEINCTLKQKMLHMRLKSLIENVLLPKVSTVNLNTVVGMALKLWRKATNLKFLKVDHSTF